MVLMAGTQFIALEALSKVLTLLEWVLTHLMAVAVGDIVAAL